MKKSIVVIAGACVLLSCSPPAVDKEAAMREVTEMLDSYEQAFAAEDATAIGGTLTDDGTFYGTDPTEAWTRAQVMSIFEQFKADSATSTTFTESSRTITLTDGGNGANIVTQGIYPFISSIVPVRVVAHAVNIEGTWKFDVVSYNMIPRNDDVVKINAAVKL
ncbi:MAG TPA: nuclear transport factor 2 family protein [Cyclobacteriaceae bacterium]|nr:nuclear transport factor 2 family protein [Cyclobacteriaceae bacterium]